jgi:hypothetical protein
MTKNKNAIIDEDIEFDEEELSIEDIEANLQAELEMQLSDLSVLEEDREKIGNPDSLGKVILDEVWTQFGNQIGLDMTNETLIQAYNREHPEEYNKAIADAIMQDEKYKAANEAMKQQHQEGTLVDSYTGKTMTASDKPNLDHVVPRKELYDNVRRKQANIDTADLANKDENLAPTNESLNKSKKDKSNQQYVDERAQREETLRKQNESAHKKIDESNKSDVEKRLEHEKIDKRLQDKLDADDDLMMEADAKARKAINKDIAKGVAKQTAKKAGKDALKAMAVAALFDLLKAIMNGLVRFFKEKHKSFKLFLTEMKESIKRFISHISSFVRTGASSLVGTVLSEIFGPVVSMFKKLASFIKQGVSTIVEAVHYLTNKENKDKPLSIKIAQVGKIVTVGLTAAGAIVGGELIEKALMQIPVMAVEIPLLGSLANITGMFLASLLMGIIGAVVINKIDQFIAKQQRNNNLNSQIDKKNEILETQDKLIDVKIQKMAKTKETASQSMFENREQALAIISEAMTTIHHENENEDGDDNDESLSKSADDLAKLLG